jgi:hypothetical protein
MQIYSYRRKEETNLTRRAFLLIFFSFFLVFVSLSRIIGGIKRRQQSTSENYRPLLMNCGAMQGQGTEAAAEADEKSSSAWRTKQKACT